MQIVTHPGQAHRDDFLACCLLINHNKEISMILRRDPTAEMMEDKNTFVIDVGMDYDPEYRNYDHHQFPKDYEASCALELVVRHELGLEEAFSKQKWWDFTLTVDSKGPVEAARLIGLDRLPVALVSPIETSLLNIFSSVDSVIETHTLWKIMDDIGAEIKNYVTRSNDVGNIAKTSEVVFIGGQKGLVWLDEESKDKATLVLDYMSDLVFSVTLDNRGPGLTLYRFFDNENIDFAKIKDHPDVEFAHVNGFIAKTKSIYVDWKALVEKSLTGV